MPWWELWNTKSSDFIYAEIPGSKTKTGLTPTPLTPRAGYVRIFLRTWRIDNIREGWNQFCGAVHGYVSVARFGQAPIEVDSFTSPNQLQNADPKHANRIVSLDYPLSGPLPYMGGDLNLKIGLFSIKSGDLAGPFLDMLTSVASAAGAGAAVAAAQPFIAPLKAGIEAITDTTQTTRLEIGLVKTYDKPTTGYFAVIRADESQIDKTKLRIDNDGHLVNDSDGKPVRDYPYFVFSVESQEQHQTWWEIPALAQAYGDLTAIVNDENSTDPIIQSAYLRFRRKVKLLPDLIPADMDRVLSEVKAKIADVRGQTVTDTAAKTLQAQEVPAKRAVTKALSGKGVLRKAPLSKAAPGKAAKGKVVAPKRSQRRKMPPLKALKIYA